MEGKKSDLTTIKLKLAEHPDSASLSDQELKSAYIDYKTKFNEEKALPEEFKGVFWFYTLDNKIPNA